MRSRTSERLRFLPNANLELKEGRRTFFSANRRGNKNKGEEKKRSPQIWNRVVFRQFGSVFPRQRWLGVVWLTNLMSLRSMNCVCRLGYWRYLENVIAITMNNRRDRYRHTSTARRRKRILSGKSACSGLRWTGRPRASRAAGGIGGPVGKNSNR